MGLSTLGDLSQSFLLRNQNYHLKVDLQNRLQELSSGEVANISSHLSGDFSILSDIEASLKLTTGFSSVLTTARSFLQGQEASLQKIRSDMSEAGIALIDAAESVDQTRRSAVFSEASTKFDTILATLNTQSAGRSLFSGDATQTTAFASSQTIMSAFATFAAGATTAPDILAAADTWFASGGGYDGTAYLGSTTLSEGFLVSKTEKIKPETSGDSEEIREVVKLYATLAAVENGDITLIEAEKSNLMSTIGQRLLELNDSLVAVEAGVGSQLGRLDDIEAENSAQSYSLQTQRKELIGVDSADTAIRLSELESQMTALYAVTARVSRLSLTGYL